MLCHSFWKSVQDASVLVRRFSAILMTMLVLYMGLFKIAKYILDPSLKILYQDFRMLQIAVISILNKIKASLMINQLTLFHQSI